MKQKVDSAGGMAGHMIVIVFSVIWLAWLSTKSGAQPSSVFDAARTMAMFVYAQPGVFICAAMLSRVLRMGQAGWRTSLKFVTSIIAVFLSLCIALPFTIGNWMGQAKQGAVKVITHSAQEHV